MNRKLTLIAAGVSLLMLLGWWFLMWSPAGSDIAAADVQFQASQAEAQSLQVQLERLQATEARMPELQSRFQTLNAAIPDSPDMAEFSFLVTQASEASGLDFLTLTATPPRGADGISGLMAVDIQLTGVGGYFQMLDFINRLQASSRVFVINDLTLASAPTTEEEELAGPTDLNVTISGQLFVSGDFNAEGA